MKKLLFCLSLLLFSGFSCTKKTPLEQWQSKPFYLQTQTEKVIKIFLAIDEKKKIQGLSGVRPQDFGENEGMLFIYKEEGLRSFWMPDTYFDLDIIFLDKDFTIVAVEKNVPHHPGTQVPPPIYTTKVYRAKYVLEIRANSQASGDMDVGKKLIWKSTPSLRQIEQGIHLRR